MKRENILAHRGRWFTPDEKNAPHALRAALEMGYGIETDFRDMAGDLVIAHDPPRPGAMTAAAFFADVAGTGSRGLLALNVKADGLQAMIADALQTAGIPGTQVFAFDMSVPDTLGYLKTGLPVYTRFSDHEPDPAVLDRAAGVWVDDFAGTTPQVAKAQAFLEAGHAVALVSPELHGRDPAAIWAQIRAAGLQDDPRVSLCTDFPDRAFDYFGG